MGRNVGGFEPGLLGAMLGLALVLRVSFRR